MTETSQEQPGKQKPLSKGEIGALRREYTPLRQRSEEVLRGAGLRGRLLKRARATVGREFLVRQRRSDIDYVTELPVRRLFEERLREEMERCQRFGSPLTMVLVDLNRLREINTNGGYPAGDEALRVVGQKLRDSSRKIDFVARYGGDEFAVLLVETPLGNIDGWWKRFLERAKEIPYTVSAGATEVDPKNIETTRKILSQLVLKAKDEGQGIINQLKRHFPD